MRKRVKRLSMVILTLFLGPLLAWSVLTVLAGSQTLPLKGQFSGEGNNFSGQITHLGRFDGIFDPGSHSAIFVAANGDMMRASYCPEESEICDQVQELVITGGTGRFAFASGSATVTGDVNPGNGAYDGRFEGTLTWYIPDDADLAARIAARQHLLDLNDDGYEELFEYDIALLGDNHGQANGSVQLRNGNIVTNLAINNGMAKCDLEYDRPFLQLNSTATSWSAGNNDSVQEVQPNVAIRISPINSSPVFESPLKWTIVTTDQPPIALSMLSGIGEGFDFSQPMVTTDTWPAQIIFNADDPCAAVVD